MKGGSLRVDGLIVDLGCLFRPSGAGSDGKQPDLTHHSDAETQHSHKPNQE